MDTAGIIGVLGGLAGIIGAIVALRNAEVSAKVSEVEVLRDIIEELTTWRDEAKKQIQALECEVQKWKAYALELYDQMRALGMEPPSIDDL